MLAASAVNPHNLPLVSGVDLGPAPPPSNFQLTTENSQTGMCGLRLCEITFLETNNISKLLNLRCILLYFPLGALILCSFKYLVSGLSLHVPPTQLSWRSQLIYWCHIAQINTIAFGKTILPLDLPARDWGQLKGLTSVHLTNKSTNVDYDAAFFFSFEVIKSFSSISDSPYHCHTQFSRDGSIVCCVCCTDLEPVLSTLLMQTDQEV